MAANRFGLSPAQVDARLNQCAAVPGITYRERTNAYRIRIKGHDEAGAKTFDEALEVWRRLKSGEATPARRARHQSVAGYAADYIEFDLAHRKPTTRRRYASVVSAYIDGTWFGDMELNEVRVEDARRYLTWLSRQYGVVSGQPLSYTTIRGVRDFLGSLFNHAADQQRLPLFRMPPTPRFGADDVPLATTAEVAPPSDEEVAMLLEAMADEWHRPLTYTLLRTGMRIGEASALQWRHLLAPNVERPRWRLRIEATWDAETHTLGSPKNGRSREIVISEDVVELLLEHRRSANPVSIEGFIFIGQGGRPVDADVYRQGPWRRMNRGGIDASRERRGVARMTPHDLRHHWATSHLAKPGVKPHQVADHLGDTVEMIQKTYRHWLPADDDSLAAAMALTRPEQSRTEVRA